MPNSDFEIMCAGEIQKLHLAPDDRVVVTFPYRLTQEDRQYIYQTLKRFTPEDTKILVLDSGVKLQIVSLSSGTDVQAINLESLEKG